jgi:hypothetical protein
MTELAAIGHERFAAAMRAYGAEAPLGSLDYLVEISRGYAFFAVENPHLFRLIFRLPEIDTGNDHFRAAASASFRVPVEGIGALHRAQDPMADPELARQVIGLWSLVHGFADLLLSNQFARATGEDYAGQIDALLPPLVRQFLGDDAGSPAGIKNAAGKPAAQVKA